MIKICISTLNQNQNLKFIFFNLAHLASMHWWQDQYSYIYSSGNIQLLCITDPEMVKEISLCTSLNLGKPSYLSKDRGPLLGQGILLSNGAIWAHQRKIIAPELYIDKVKVYLKVLHKFQK